MLAYLNPSNTLNTYEFFTGMNTNPRNPCSQQHFATMSKQLEGSFWKHNVVSNYNTVKHMPVWGCATPSMHWQGQKYLLFTSVHCINATSYAQNMPVTQFFNQQINY